MTQFEKEQDAKKFIEFWKNKVKNQNREKYIKKLYMNY